VGQLGIFLVIFCWEKSPRKLGTWQLKLEQLKVVGLVLPRCCICMSFEVNSRRKKAALE